MKYIRISGKDVNGNRSFVNISTSKLYPNCVCFFTPEDCSDVVLTIAQAKEVAEAILECIGNCDD